MYPFPPPDSIESLPWHLLFTQAACGLVVVSITGVWLLRRKRRPRRFDVAIWIASGLLLTGLLPFWVSPYSLAWREHLSVLVAQWVIVVFGIIASEIQFQRRRVGDRSYVAGAFIFSIVGLAAWLVLEPTATRDGTPARRTLCRNNLMQIGLAMHNYYDMHESFPPHAGNEPPQSWRVALLPYLDQAPLYNNYFRAEPWNSEGNLPIARTRVEAYLCPSAEYHERIKDSSGAFWTSYVAAVGPDAIFETDHTRTKSEIPDGLSNTAMVVEACGQEIIWTEPRDLTMATTPLGVNLPGAAEFQSDGILSSFHTSGAMTLIADGSVRFVPKETSPDVLKKLLQADDGPPEDF